MNQSLNSHLHHWRQNHQTIVLATGVFDLLHPEHQNFLARAKAAGDRLIVGLETDARVKTLKGSHRPNQSQNLRLHKVKALPHVDFAFLLPKKFDTPADWLGLLHRLKPNIYAVSSHTTHLQTKRVLCAQAGVKLKIVHRHNPTVSTTILLKT